MSESDDDDFSNLNSRKKRKQLKKTSKNKIEDSDSSSDENGKVTDNDSQTKTIRKKIEDDESNPDENVEVRANSSQTKPIRNRIEDDESSSDEKGELSHSNRCTEKKNDSICEKFNNKLSMSTNNCISESSTNVKSTNDHDNFDSNTDSSSRLPDLNSSNIDIDNNDESKINDESEHSNSEHSEHSNSEHSDDDNDVIQIRQKQKDNNKSKLRCFADSSSEEDSVKKISAPNERRSRKSERVNTKKSSFRSKLDIVKVRTEMNDGEDGSNVSDSGNAKGKEEEEEEAAGTVEELAEVKEIDVNKLLQNNDLFDMDASDDDQTQSKKTLTKGDNDENGNENENEIRDDDSVDSVDELINEINISKKKKTGKEGKRSKDAWKEAKSEQQRLLREQKFRLPYHVPEAKPLKDFLQRVPVLKTSKEKRKKKADTEETIAIDEDNGVVETGENKPKHGIDSLFQQKPKLSFGSEEVIEFEESIEFEDVKLNDTSKKKGVLDSFMARFDKHTRKDLQNKTGSSTSPIVVNNLDTAKNDDKVPGGRRVAFKEEMRRKIRKERCENLKELEKEMKLYNEEDSSEEEESDSDDEEDKESDDDDQEGKDAQEAVADVDVDAVAGGGGESSNDEDEELSKWNLEDERKALELEMGEEKKSEEANQNTTESIDFSIQAIKRTQSERQEKDDMMHWDDTSSTVSSVLPAGQGDPTSVRKNSLDGGRLTPFSKLIKSGLLDSASKQNENSSSNPAPPCALSLPCEDTQDLYKDVSVSARQLDEEESESVFDNFRLYLNEESQYTQACDSQGFLNDSKKSKRQPVKRLFDEDVKESVNDFSEVIGLCSGKFDDDNCTSSVGAMVSISNKRLFDEDTKERVNDFSEVIGLCSGKFDDDNCTSSVGAVSISNKGEIQQVCSSNNELSMSQVIGLCSGKFSNDDAMVSSKINSQSNVVCNENDDTSFDNPPMEHPFSSRVNANDNESVDLPPFVDTHENIFSTSFSTSLVHPKLSKPSRIADIIDENFDDNAIDFCSAPFSSQSSNKEHIDDGVSELEDDELLPKTKFNVENWLKGDKQIDEFERRGKQIEDEFDRGGSDSVDSNGGVGKTMKKRKRIVESDDEDNEDEVFEDKHEKDKREDDEDEEEEEEEEDEDQVEDEEVDNEGGVDDAVSSEEEDAEDHVEEEVADELLEYQDAIAGKQKKWSKNAFTEKEAELSGSDINSDDEDLGSEYDEYEVDSDIENLPDAEKLKRQVHKIHQRKLMDEDQQEVKLLQELYLADGDLGDGKKRQRNFKWRNIDNDENNFNKTTHSGDEEDELNLDTDISQKLERAEREKYIHELHESQKGMMDENSQSMLEMIKDHTSIVTEPSTQKPKPKLVLKSVEGRVLSQKQLGSFLSQKKSSLSHLSSAAKASGGQGSKAFVFQATEEEKKISSNKENKAARKAPFAGPAKKRVKVSNDGEASESQSIFDLL